MMELNKRVDRMSDIAASRTAIDDDELVEIIEAEPIRPAQVADRKAKARAAMLDGPIVPTLLKLAIPTLGVLVAQTAVNVAEAYYVGFLGTDALAGGAMVFPIFMLMMTMSNGGLGSGVASAVARSIGAGRQDDADALVLHAVV